MRIIKTKDENYPIKFDDSWGEGAYLNKDTIINDKEWQTFVAELEAVRIEIKNNYNEEAKNKELEPPDMAFFVFDFIDGERKGEKGLCWAETKAEAFHIIYDNWEFSKSEVKYAGYWITESHGRRLLDSSNFNGDIFW